MMRRFMVPPGNMMAFGQDNDSGAFRGVMVFAGLPSRRNCRTQSRSDPVPVVVMIGPAFEIRDEFALVKDAAVVRDRHGDRDDLRRFDRLGGSDDDRSRGRRKDRAHQAHDVDRKLKSPARTGFPIMFVPRESGRGEDDRGSEHRADDDCFADGLLGRVSYGEKLRFLFRRQSIILDFLTIQYSELFDLSNRF